MSNQYGNRVVILKNRDFQQRKVYKAEANAQMHRRGKEFQTLNEIKSYITGIEYLLPQGENKPTFIIRKQRSDSIFQAGMIERWGFNEWKLILGLPCPEFVILHEIAHCLTSRHGHDKVFCEKLLWLVENCMGQEYKAILVNAFWTRGVKFV